MYLQRIAVFRDISERIFRVSWLLSKSVSQISKHIAFVQLCLLHPLNLTFLSKPERNDERPKY